jgi:hypothetical protein
MSGGESRERRHVQRSETRLLIDEDMATIRPQSAHGRRPVTLVAQSA